MSYLKRYICNQVLLDLGRKMVFVGGPRQAGKTTFSLHLRPKPKTTYLNWDIDEDRTRILDKELGHTSFLILDEIHKFRRWRNYLKGIYDGIKAGSQPKREILVTGSAHLEYYRYKGDSLQGRYHLIRLLPLSLNEIQSNQQEGVESLLRYGGFPEPFILQSETETRRWSREYRARVIRDEVRELEQVQDLASIELLLNALVDHAGSILSINSVREDLQVAHRTVDKWIQILERLYLIYRIPPIGGPKIRAVKKEQKLFFYDWTAISDEGARFENLVATHLQKYVFWRQDANGESVELRYFRDSDGREVDFVLVNQKKPILMVECKLSDREVSSHLKYLSQKYPKVPAWQVYMNGKKDYLTPHGIRVAPVCKLLETLV